MKGTFDKCILHNSEPLLHGMHHGIKASRFHLFISCGDWKFQLVEADMNHWSSHHWSSSVAVIDPVRLKRHINLRELKWKNSRSSEPLEHLFNLHFVRAAWHVRQKSGFDAVDKRREVVERHSLLPREILPCLDHGYNGFSGDNEIARKQILKLGMKEKKLRGKQS